MEEKIENFEKNRSKNMEIIKLIRETKSALEKKERNHRETEKLQALYSSNKVTISQKREFENLLKEQKKEIDQLERSIEELKDLGKKLVCEVKAREPYSARNMGEIDVKENDRLILRKVEKSNAYVHNTSSLQKGFIPFSHLLVVKFPQISIENAQKDLLRIRSLLGNLIPSVSSQKKRGMVLFDFEAVSSEQINLKIDEIVEVENYDQDNYLVHKSGGKNGIAPKGYIDIMDSQDSLLTDEISSEESDEDIECVDFLEQKNPTSSLISLYDFEAVQEDELSIKPGQPLLLISRDDDWTLVKNNIGRQGFVPSTHVQEIEEELFFQLQAICQHNLDQKAQVVADYRALESNELSLNEGIIVKVNEQNPDGWWLVEYDGKKKENNKEIENEYGIVAFDYEAKDKDEISMEKGKKIKILERNNSGWFLISDGKKSGFFPGTFIDMINNSNEIQNQIQNENQNQKENQNKINYSNQNQINSNQNKKENQNQNQNQNKINYSNQNENQNEKKKFFERNSNQRISHKLIPKENSPYRQFEKRTKLNEIKPQISNSPKENLTKTNKIQEIKNQNNSQQENEILKKENENLKKKLFQSEKKIEDLNKENLSLRKLITDLETKVENEEKLLQTIRQLQAEKAYYEKIVFEK
ncbi:sh3 multiple domain [Anaeramoeba ignava]|uniref:Sh3 multiple domain n=1 Tax=Anaeramoeba ignava TaxID=1746090 RepID=A0A9Q0R4V4_ANAIG|nr:sh3 multiple domain [Anaeramoeba ignava]